MDKYEYKLKLEQLKELVSMDRYYEAAAITDEINWNKVRNIGTLTMVGKVYEHLKRYEDARDVFALAYDRSPVSKTVLLHLTKLAIRLGNADDAEGYYEEFVECAPRDRVRYELAYEIAKLRNASVEERILILKQFKEKEYTEECALELAKLYHEAGMEKECVATCDELFIWFGEGDYVRQALELKASITPLSELQQQKLPILQEQSRLQWEEEQRRREQERLEAERRELERIERERQEALRREEEARLAAEEGREVGDREVDRAFPEGSAKWNDEKLKSRESVGDYDGSINGREMVGSAVGKFKNLFKNVSRLSNRAEDEYLEEEEDAFLEDLEAATIKADTVKRDTSEKQTGELPVTESKPVEEAILEQALSEVDMTPEKPVEPAEEKKTTLIQRLTARLQVPEEPNEGDYDEDDAVEDALDEWNHTKKKLDRTIEKVSSTENLDERRAQAAKEMNDIMSRLAQLQAILQPEGDAKDTQETDETAPQAPAGAAEGEAETAAEETVTRVPAAQSPVAESMAEATAEEVSEAKRGVEEAARRAKEEFEKAAAAEAAAKAAAEEAAERAEAARAAAERAAAAAGAEAVTAAPQVPAAAEEAVQTAADIPAEEEEAETAPEAQAAKELAAEAAQAAAEPAAAEPEAEVVQAEPEKLAEAYDDPAAAIEAGLAKAEAARAAAEAGKASAESELDTAYFRTEIENASAQADGEGLPEEEILPMEEILPEEEVPEPAQATAPAEEAAAPAAEITAAAPVTEEIAADAAATDDPAAGTPLEKEPDDFRPLTEEQKEMFSYFVSVPGLARQISRALEGSSVKTKDAVASTAGNMIIQGPSGIGKTVLATNLIKAVQMENGKEKSRIGKISAVSLNKRDFATLLDKVAGGYLIIEKAGNLSEESVARMAEVMEGETGGLVVVLEDTPEGISGILEMNEAFAEKFTEVVTVPEFSVDDLVEFGKSYAYEMECVIEEMGVLALHTRIQNIQKIDHATMLAEVKEIVDGAIEHAESHNKRRFGRHAKRYTDDDYLILREEDFSV